ncbi:MAG: hypothetical protein IJ356_05170 [Erysipelotrichaceae bacterium]|nr:hypothetical protein [Erysipelotrichaceae bacterium]
MRKIILLLLCVCLCGCVSQTVEPDPTPDSQGSSHGCAVLAPCGDEKADMSAYENFMDSDHVFLEASFEEVLDAIENKQTFVLYIGFSTCPWCLEAMPILNEVAKEFDASISYINTRPDNTRESELRVLENEGYAAFRDVVIDVLSENDEGEKHLYVPFVFFFKEGQIVSYHEDTFPEHDAHERTMTQEEIERLTEIYRDGFESLLSE